MFDNPKNLAEARALSGKIAHPNPLTRETLAKSERGEAVHHAKNVHDLFEQLGI